MIKNKKSQIFELLIPILMFILCSIALFLFITNSGKLKLSLLSPTKLSDMYTSKDKFMLFAEDSAKLSIMQAYYEIARDNRFAGNCVIDTDGYIKLCEISESLNNEFAAKITEIFSGYLNSFSDKQFEEVNYKINVNNEIVNFDSEKINLHTQIQGILFPFGTIYTFDPSFRIDMKEFGLDNLGTVVKTSRDCFDKTKSLNSITECIKQIKTFSPSIKIEGNKAFFDLTSNKRFFYSQDSQPVYDTIKIKFYLED